MTVALITGAAGQDGSYLSELLLEEGATVHGVVRPGHDAGAVDGVELHTLDLTDTAAVAELVAELRPDAVYNLAAVSSVFQSWQQPVSTTEVNVLPVVALLESTLRLQEDAGRPVRFVQASSAEIFGSASESPQSEQTPIRPTSPYGATKAFGQHLVEIYRTRGLAASSCILYNHESPRRPETFVTRKITAAAARIAAGLQDTLELGGLDMRRDWGWAPDYAEALRLAAQADDPGDFVIATGETHSIADFVRIAFARAGITDWERHVVISQAFARPADPAEQVGDASKARRVLGWEPTRSFEALVEAMVDHDLALVREASGRADG
ncbi:GDP-mannose 4,6-dehydratase [Agromyces sp. LHK192]|uniref:GDP-mannose 4,6-dehydratase n=1 Tax=Agromyces sp. LHK192 TaxID=2498704 RepID=UPI000FD88F81|nr:GDP-mannose 4,6-dehydratase [Agromyces sp. LHK192]